MSGVRGTTVLAAGAAGGALALILGLAILGGSISNDPGGGDGADGALELDAKRVPKEHRSWVLKAAKQCKAVNAPLLAAQIDAESGWNPRAQSPVGAKGISQFMPGTWSTWGVDADGDGSADPFTPADAIMSQARYDCWLAKKVGDIRGDTTRLMLAAYNAGPGAVEKYNGIPPYPETQQYVKRITALMREYSKGTSSIGGGMGGRIVAYAEKQIGTPYSWGGGDLAGPTYGVAQGIGTRGFDCSSLLRYAVYHASGKEKLTLPRVSQAQAKTGTTVEKEDLQPGDAIFMSLNGGGLDHVGIYVGADRMVHAPRTGQNVQHADLTSTYYANRAWTIRRYR